MIAPLHYTMRIDNLSKIGFLCLLLLFGCQQKPDVVFTSPQHSEVRNPESEIRNAVQIQVPFTPQAPFADWGDPYQEACEEAALIMVHHYLSGTDLTRGEADAAILELTRWEVEKEYPEDVTLDELAIIAERYYEYTAEIVEDPTLGQLKSILSKGNPIIVPASGRDLGNPYFSGEGPWYHMLVLTGFDEKHFITNDPGTRRGENYTYKYETLLNAIHDWTGVKEEIRTGHRRVLLLYQ